MGLFDSITKLTKDVAEIVTAPIEIAVDLTRQITKPIADAAKEIVEDVKEDLDD